MKSVQLTVGLSAILFLTACGGENTGGVAAEGTVVIAPTPSPTPTTSTGAGPIEAPATTLAPALPTSTAFADYQFSDGKAYPATPTLTIEPATFKPGAAEVFVPIKLSGPAPTTVLAYVLPVSGTGPNAAVEGTNFSRGFIQVVFRPGDPLTQTVRIPVKKTTEGMAFGLQFPTVPQGATQANGSAKIVATDAVPATARFAEAPRAPRTFKATGTLQFELTPASLSFSDGGGTRELSTRLSHGRSQPGNQETGIYLDKKLYPDVEAPVMTEGDAIVLHSQQLAKPITYQGISYPHGASVLSGHATTAAQIGYGQYEWEARMPDRRGSWPALWLISTAGWPPEIDVYEGFGASSSWNFNTMLSHTIHGGQYNNQTYVRGVGYNSSDFYGLSGFSASYHKYAVDIQKDYITWFVDGVETYQCVNGFAGKRWYPIMNVAVLKSGDYSGGNGDMYIRSMRVYAN